ncbi:NAD-dependent epimerase/dehydratase family protein, partial [bacterium]|nr:NAD-dependent epimerase/dehydratase family protein [bacterium]
DEVFGSIKRGKFKEDSSFKPNSPYSASKASGDLLCRSYIKTYDLPIIITHSCNFYGPYQYPEKLIPLFITNLIENKKVPLYGDGKNVREWIYVLDHCRAIDFLLHKGKLGEVYNIGSGVEKKNIEITKLILKELGLGDERIKKVKDRAGHDWRYAVDSTKLRKLGWSAEYDFDDAIRETIRWYQNNDWWWKPIKSGEYLEYYKKQYK